MKSGFLSPGRVDPEIRDAATSAQSKCATLSSSIEQLAREQAPRHNLQQEFMTRGLASREARQTDDDFEAAAVHTELRSMLSSGATTLR